MNDTEVGVQGLGAHEVFEGKGGSDVISKIYAESAKFMADLIRSCLEKKGGSYELLDVGTFKGELVGAIKRELADEYSFHITGIDKSDAVDFNLEIDEKIKADIVPLPFPDKAFDIVITRYVLPWNNLEKQKEIIKELRRVCKGYVIIQHVGAERTDTCEWQNRMHSVLFGAVPKLLRKEGYFSSPSEVENWMSELNFKYEKVQDRTIELVSDVLREKYDLNLNEVNKVKEILGDKDVISQTTWVIDCR